MEDDRVFAITSISFG